MKKNDVNESMAARFTVLAAVTVLAIMMLGACSSRAAEPSGSAGAGEASTEEIKIADFKSVDLNGNEVTQEVFAGKEVTMINFWGTYCGPCIAEMPELAGLEDEYDGRIQVIGVPIDVDFDDPESNEYVAAIKILETAGAGFTNVKPDGGILEYMKTMQYVPTSIFVDSEGTIVGGPVVGGNFAEYKRIIEDNLN